MTVPAPDLDALARETIALGEAATPGPWTITPNTHEDADPGEHFVRMGHSSAQARLTEAEGLLGEARSVAERFGHGGLAVRIATFLAPRPEPPRARTMLDDIIADGKPGEGLYDKTPCAACGDDLTKCCRECGREYACGGFHGCGRYWRKGILKQTWPKCPGCLPAANASTAAPQREPDCGTSTHADSREERGRAAWEGWEPGDYTGMSNNWDHAGDEERRNWLAMLAEYSAPDMARIADLDAKLARADKSYRRDVDHWKREFVKAADARVEEKLRADRAITRARLEAAERVVEAARALEFAVLIEAGARESMHAPRAVLAASLDALDAAAPARAGDGS